MEVGCNQLARRKVRRTFSFYVGGMRLKTGLALSGGGIRGTAHVGVLKALEEYNIKFDCISGASMGAVVASLYAAGYKSGEIEKLLQGMDWKRLLGRGLSMFTQEAGSEEVAGFLPSALGDTAGIERELKGFFREKGIKTMADFKMELALPAVSLNTGATFMFVSNKKFLSSSKTQIYDDCTPAWEAVTASLSVPIMFRPKPIMNHFLADGGLKNNLPVDVLRLYGAEKVLAVNLSAVEEKNIRFTAMTEIVSQSVSILTSELTNYSGDRADYQIRPEIKGVNFLEYRKIPRCIGAGYESAIREMPQILNMLYLK